MATTIDVLVVGAGPTGLMMACQLARQGVSFRIIDDRADHLESRAFALQARSMEIFEQLGLGDDLSARVKRGDPARLDVNGRPVAELRFDAIAGETRFASVYLAPQPDIEEVLHDDLDTRDIPVERPIRMVAFEQDAEGVTAELEHCISGVRETIRCAYLVGCDGVHSRVRDALAIEVEDAMSPVDFVLADVALGYRPTPLELYVTRRAVAVVATCGELTRIMGVRLDRPAPAHEQAVTVEEVAELLRAARAPIEIARVEWVSRFCAHHRTTRRFRIGRVFLAGDACHSHSPLGGQGMNTGFQDAANLAWKLAFVLRGAPAELLDSYERERQRVGEILLRTTDRAFGLLLSRRRGMELVRGLATSMVVARALGSRRLRDRVERFVSELDIRYHASPFVRAELEGADHTFRHGLHAGCRVPDLAVGGVSLHVMLQGPSVHVLAFGACDERALAALEIRHPARVKSHLIRATPGAREAYERFGVTGSAVYVIRPDHHVGYRACGPSLAGAVAYLDHLLGFPPWSELPPPQIVPEDARYS